MMQVFTAEYARSGRSKCRGCAAEIAKGDLRLAEVIQSKFHKGYDFTWYHAGCFYAKHPNATRLDIGGFDELKSEDQELLQKYADGSVPVPKMEVPGRLGLEGLENSGEFRVEYAKSNKSRCVSCEGRIIRGEIRISQKDYTSKRALKLPMGCLDRWHHVDCFVQTREDLKFFGSAYSIDGISWLKKSDQDELIQKLPRIDEAQGNEENAMVNETVREPCSKRSADPVLEKTTKQDPILLESIKVQEDLVSFHKKAIIDNIIDMEQIVSVLEANNQDVPVGEDQMIERLADIMTFGALERCTVCKGQLILKQGYGYKCTGYISEFTKCTKLEKEPQRFPFVVPEDLKSLSPFNTFEFIPRTRIFVERDEDWVPVRKLPKLDKLPLFNMKFLISDTIDQKTAAEIQSKVEEFGGKVVPRLNTQITAVFSTSVEVDMMTARIRFASTNNIPVISPDFVYTITVVDFDFEVNVKKFLLSSWMCSFSNAERSESLPLRCLGSKINEMR